MNSSITVLLPPSGMEAYIGILWTCKITKDVFPFISKCPKGSKWQDHHNSLVNMFIWIYLWFAHKVSSRFIKCFVIFGLCQLYLIFSWHFWQNWWVFVFFVCSPSLPIPLDGIFPGSKISVHFLKIYSRHFQHNPSAHREVLPFPGLHHHPEPRVGAKQ